MKKLFYIFLFISSFAKAQWTQQVSGTTNDLLEVFFPATDTGFVCGWNGTILHTMNGGTNWTTQSSGTTKHLLDIFFLNTQTGFVVGDSGYFAKTINGGTTWSGQYITQNNVSQLGCVFFTSATTGYVGGMDGLSSGRILKTTNGGTSWTMSNTPTSNLSINYQRLNFPTLDTGYALTRGICVKTIDAGANWFITDTALYNSGGMFSILEDAFFFSADTGYICGWYNGFSGYTVDGYHWTDQLASSNNQWYSVDFPSRQIGYMVGWGQLIKTVNGGQSWWDITTSLINGGPGIFSMDFTDNTTGYACGTGGYIIKTTNGGTNGIFEHATQNNLNIFPNPFSDHTTIRLSETIDHGTVSIKNVLGKTVRETEIKNTSEIIIEKNNLTPGIYFVIIDSEKGRAAAKLIVE